jgi:hypothetical protein
VYSDLGVGTCSRQDWVVKCGGERPCVSNDDE